MPQCNYLPEGVGALTPLTEEMLSRAAQSGAVLQALATGCTESHDLLVDLGGWQGVIAREQADLGVKLGKTRDIAILSRVGKPVNFVVQGAAEAGAWRLSRAEAQRRAMEWHMNNTAEGDVITGKITHLESFGAFVDIGCGAVSFIGVENISVSRISHPRQRFAPGQSIYAAVLEKDASAQRMTLTHRELLGTWEQNAARISADSTVCGIVRSVKDYGAFIELLPNLSGLAEMREGLKVGDGVSVFIKSVTASCMKIKLVIIDVLEAVPSGIIRPQDYFITSGRLEHWRYSAPECPKIVERIFTSSAPNY